MSTKERAIAKRIVRQRRAVRNAVRTISIGLGGCLAVNGHFYNKRLHKIVNTSDSQALRSDWQAVGNDMRHAIDNFKSSI